MARVSGDLSSLEKQLEQTDVIFGAGAVIQLASFVLKSLLLLFTKHQKGVIQPPSRLPDDSFIVVFYKTAMQFSIELNWLDEWCEMFQSWQLPFIS